MRWLDRSMYLCEKAIAKKIEAEDLLEVIQWNPEALSALFSCADQIRREFFGNNVMPCVIMNIKSGGCPENCAFCSQSIHHGSRISNEVLPSREEILENYTKARIGGMSFGVVASGRRLSRSQLQFLGDVLSGCQGNVHASLGILDEEDFRLLSKSGVVCYNHNLETSRDFFPQVVSSHEYEERLETIKRAKRADMAVCCGGLFGMGETWVDRLKLCLELRDLDVDIIPLNFFHPFPGTPLSAPTETPLEFLKIVSLFRLAHPDKVIKVCGGRELNLGRLQPLMFYAGANGYISGDYLTTRGDSVEADEEMIQAFGLWKSL